MSREALAQGHYAARQIFSRNPVVAWSHSSRFALARRLVSPRAGGALLDYGCGDGTFVALAHDLFRESVGADIEGGQVRGCSERFAALENVRFVETNALQDCQYSGRYDAVVCMEVLEHCPSDIQPHVLADLARLSAPGGIVVISVPIETGPTLGVKQAVRAVAAASGLKEYAHRERYGFREFLRMLFAGAASRTDRPESTSVGAGGIPLRFTGHKGFNWRALEPLIAASFAIEQRLYSPMPLMRWWLNSQVWFVCRTR